MIHEMTPAEMFRFFRAGGTFSEAAWVKMDSETQEAILMVREKLREETTARILHDFVQAMAPAMRAPDMGRMEPDELPSRDPEEHGRPLIEFPTEVGG